MPDCTQTSWAIRDLIARRWPERFQPDQIDECASLGSEGLGLDSVEIVEVITACEELTGRQASADLFAVVPLTVKRMSEFFLH